MNPPQRFFHLHLVSDATGETLIAVGRAAAAQYPDARAIEHVYPLIRSERQLARVIEEINASPGLVLFTVIEPHLSAMIIERCKDIGVPAVSVLDPVLTEFRAYLGAPADRRIGAQHALDASYFQRIEALNFTMEHDDGQLPQDIDAADVVIIGISRTSKTPTSIYLANRGVKTANIPVVLGMALPPALDTARNPLIVGLVATADRVSQVRQNRALGVTTGYDSSTYIDRAHIAEEIAYVRQLCARHGWPVIDVTRRSIEETAAAILALRDRAR